MATSITVEIDSVSYQVYANVGSADSYLGGSLASQAVAWRAATTDTKSRGLVEATRWLDELTWKGTRVDDPPGLEWPRSGVDGYSSTEVPQKVIDAAMQLAALFVQDPELKNNLKSLTTAQKRLKAGSVEIEYFRGGSVKVSTPVPTLIMPLIKSLLSSDRYANDGAYNTDREGDFGDNDDYDLNSGI